MLDAYREAENAIGSSEVIDRLGQLRERVELDFLREDIPLLIKESKEGIDRVGRIVKDLKDFSRVDSNQEWQWTNLQQGIESTLNIVANELKYKADVVKEFQKAARYRMPAVANQSGNHEPDRQRVSGDGAGAGHHHAAHRP